MASGRDVGGAGFLGVNGVPWGISFSRRKTPATPSMGAVSDLWVAPLPEALVSDLSGGKPPVPAPLSQPTLVVANCSDRWAPAWVGQSRFIMVDERPVVSSGAGKGQRESVGTLVRVNSQYQSDLRFEDISAFTAGAEDRLLFRQVPAGNETPGLFLWDGQDQRRLGDVANANELDMQFVGSTAYFILGSDRVLSRLGSLSDSIQDLHANVSRYVLRGDQRFGALALSNAGVTKTVVLDLQSGKDIPLARPNPCCWIGFATDEQGHFTDQFTYSQSAGPDAPAEYHTLDLVSGADTALILPAPLVDFASAVNRNSDEVLYLDSQGHGVFYGRNDLQVRRTVERRLLTPKFSPDGQYLIYIDPQPTTPMDPYRHGPLMVQDADLLAQPRQLTPPGMSVGEGNFFFIPVPKSPILVFWAYVVRAATDLYFANHETGDLQVVAGAIGSVIVVNSQQIFGTVHMSAQDQVGDLVVQDVRDIVQNAPLKPLARAVPQYEFTQDYDMVAYVVRGRAPSDHDGLWVTRWPHPPDQDGGQ